MSRVNDDNSDNRRIREMNEAAHNRKIRQEKRGLEARTERSFREVMSEKGRRETAQKADQRDTGKDARGKRESALDRVRKDAPRSQLEHGRRAAMARAMLKGGALKRRQTESADASLAASARAEELLAKSELELEHVDKEARREDEHEVVRSDEKQAEVRQQAADGQHGPVDADGRQQRQSQQQGSDGRSREDPNAPTVSAAQGAAGSRVTIPPEMIRHIVSAIYKAVSADGRTSMQVTLKGGKLEGIKLEIHTEGGRVRCNFTGCGKELKSMLEGGKRALAAGLARRGLKLERLTATP